MQLPQLPRLPQVFTPRELRFLFFWSWGVLSLGLLTISVAGMYAYQNTQAKLVEEQEKHLELQHTYEELQSEHNDLRTTDQLQRNDDLETKIAAIEASYDQAVERYEDLVDLSPADREAAEELFAQSLQYLAEQNYASSSATLVALEREITSIQSRQVVATVLPDLASLPASTAPPGQGFARQAVDTSIGRYQVSIITADMNSTRVIVDTASSGDCGNDCPVLPLATYVSRNGAFAGINGSYFCPASYPSCAGKTNTFDTLLMNKDKVYFNSDNNVYSTVPAVIFSGNSARFVGQSQEWGRDTGVDAVLANQPLLVSNGNVVFGGDGDPKKGSKGNRSFVGASGSNVYIGVVHNATVAEAAIALQALGIQNALNLDSGGSTALWSGGYKAGPGRDIPNALLFVNK